MEEMLIQNPGLEAPIRAQFNGLPPIADYAFTMYLSSFKSVNNEYTIKINYCEKDVNFFIFDIVLNYNTPGEINQVFLIPKNAHIEVFIEVFCANVENIVRRIMSYDYEIETGSYEIDSQSLMGNKHFELLKVQCLSYRNQIHLSMTNEVTEWTNFFLKYFPNDMTG